MPGVGIEPTPSSPEWMLIPCDRDRADGLEGRSSPISLRPGLTRGIDREFLSYCVSFRASRPADETDNFNMEREWRALNHIRFALSDVRRVILPEKWARPFRVAIPE